MKNRHVAVTGLGAVCCLGHNVPDIWIRVKEGVSGISLIDSFSTDNLPVKIAGAVKDFQLSDDVLPAREHSRYDRFIHFALQASHEALVNGGLKDFSVYPAEKIGCILGVGIGGFNFIEKNHLLLQQKGSRRVHPFFIPGLIPNMAAGAISIKQGIKGISYTISSACASAGHAISAACEEIISGRHHAMITGGVESTITALAMAGFASMKALSKNTDQPKRASRPFDAQRNGFVMGEGAGILLLEDKEQAQARGATIYAEIRGHGLTSDAFHISAPDPLGQETSRCMTMALKAAGIQKEQVGYINAHGTSTPLGDIAETKAIKKTFGEHAKKLQISSTKSMTGHLLGAAGGIESIFTTMALHENILPPTINQDTPDPECDLDYIPNKARKTSVEYALNNSFGFGGTNSSLIFKKH